MQFSDEFLERWEHIIDDVDITDVPLECIKKVVVKLYGKKPVSYTHLTLPTICSV